MFRSTKEFFNFPCSHRQWSHDDHCSFIHGYSRSFKFEFEADELTKEGFVADFGMFKEFKEYLIHMFDHTFLINKDDPMMDMFNQMNDLKLIQLRVLENVGMEGTSKFLFDRVNNMIETSYKKDFKRGLRCIKVETRENNKNAASYSIK